MLKLYFILIFLGLPARSALLAQDVDTVFNRTNFWNILNSEVARRGASDHTQALFTFNTRYEGLKGTPYVHEAPLPAKLVFSDGVASDKEDLKLMFDVYENRVWAVGRENPLRGFDLTPAQIRSFELRFPDGRTARFEAFRLDEKERPIWCEVLHAGEKYTFVKRHKKKFKKADYKNDGLRESGSPYDRFENDDEFQIKLKDGAFERVVLKKNALLKFAGVSEKGPVAAFCKEKKIGGALKPEEAAVLLAFLDVR
jgi:hypothetical protein